MFDRSVDWFVLRHGQFERLEADEQRLLRSEVFPGLCLDPKALIAGDLAAVCHTQQAALGTSEHAEFVSHLAEARSAP